jgi:arylsulfatase
LAIILKKQFIMKKSLIILMLVLVTGLVSAQEKPNIVVIMTDNLGYGDLGIYGGMRAPTPRIDNLAREGIQFRDFQVEPGCTPSRAAFITGRMAVRSGNSTIPLIGTLGGLAPEEVTMAEMLKGAGYSTALFGKWHLGETHERQPQNQGFDQFWGFLFSSAPSDPDNINFQMMDVPMQPILAAKSGEKAKVVNSLTTTYRGLIDNDITKKSVDYITEKSKDEEPFFLFVSFVNPHHPVIPHPDFKGKSGGGAYSDALMEIDYNTGRILDAIDGAGAKKNTIVIWFSDNGPTRYSLQPYQNGDAGPWSGELGTAWEGGLRTAGMISWPGTIEASISDEIFHEMDFFPTIAKWAGTSVPKDRPIDGINQSDYLLGNQPNSARDHVAVYYNGELTAIRYQHFKIHYRLYDKWNSNLLATPPDKLLVPSLFNLRADPKEKYNIIGGTEGISWGILVKASQILSVYEKSFKEFPNNEYSKMQRSN